MTTGLGKCKAHVVRRYNKDVSSSKSQLDQISQGDASLMPSRQASGSISFLRNNPSPGILPPLVIINPGDCCNKDFARCLCSALFHFSYTTLTLFFCLQFAIFCQFFFQETQEEEAFWQTAVCICINIESALHFIPTQVALSCLYY